MEVVSTLEDAGCGLSPTDGGALSPPRRALLLDLGLTEYTAAYALQSRLNLLRQTGKIPDVVLIMEHAPCITLGRASRGEHILVGSEELEARGIAMYATDRGGDVTYHGPGQLVLYAIVHLDGYGRDVHAHARRLEEVIIQTLATFGVRGTRIDGYPGVWTVQGKIGALGLSVKRWVTMHGLALNVCPDMSAFELIVPCGITEREVTCLADLPGLEADMGLTRLRLRESFESIFGMSLVEMKSDDVLPL